MTNGKMISGLVGGQLAAVESMDEVGCAVVSRWSIDATLKPLTK